MNHFAHIRMNSWLSRYTMKRFIRARDLLPSAISIVAGNILILWATFISLLGIIHGILAKETRLSLVCFIKIYSSSSSRCLIMERFFSRFLMRNNNWLLEPFFFLRRVSFIIIPFAAWRLLDFDMISLLSNSSDKIDDDEKKGNWCDKRK